MQRLIINADDWGLSSKFNDGILDLVASGIVTSTTVMINKDHIEPEKLSGLKNISIGLHLDLPEKSDIQEVENQIKKFNQLFGKLPSHLDGHQHCHLLPKKFAAVLKIAKKYDLPVRSTIETNRIIIKKAGIKTPNNYISWYPSPIYTERLIDKLKKTRSSSTELVCHPGYYDKNCLYPYNKEREKELLFLNSLEFKDTIKKFELINYRQL